MCCFPGISKIKSAAAKAFKTSQRGQRFYLRETEGEVMTMMSVETVTDALLEIMEVLPSLSCEDFA